MSKLTKAKDFKKSKAGMYLTIGTTLFSAVSVLKQVKTAKADDDKLKLADAAVSAAAIVTGVALLVRELRRRNAEDILAD